MDTPIPILLALVVPSPLNWQLLTTAPSPDAALSTIIALAKSIFDAKFGQSTLQLDNLPPPMRIPVGAVAVTDDISTSQLDTFDPTPFVKIPEAKKFSTLQFSTSISVPTSITVTSKKAGVPSGELLK